MDHSPGPPSGRPSKLMRGLNAFSLSLGIVLIEVLLRRTSRLTASSQWAPSGAGGICL